MTEKNEQKEDMKKHKPVKEKKANEEKSKWYETKSKTNQRAQSNA